jgi:hypothetical protein
MSLKFRHLEDQHNSVPVVSVEWQSVPADAYCISDERVKEWVEEIAEYLLKEENSDQHFSYRMSGDTLVMVARDDELLLVEVTKRKKTAYIKVD